MISHNSSHEVRQTFAAFLKNASLSKKKHQNVFDANANEASEDDKKHQLEFKIGTKYMSCLRRLIDFQNKQMQIFLFVDITQV